MSLSSNAGVYCSVCTIEDVQFAGVVQDAYTYLALQSSEIASISPHETFGGGFGLFASCYDADGDDCSLTEPNITLVANDVTVHDTALSALYLSGPGEYIVLSSDIEAGGVTTWGPDTVGGTAIYSERGSLTLDYENDKGLYVVETSISGAETTGILLQGSSLASWGNIFEDNNVDIVAQGCDVYDMTITLVEGDDPAVELCPEEPLPYISSEYYEYTVTLSDLPVE